MGWEHGDGRIGNGSMWMVGVTKQKKKKKNNEMIPAKKGNASIKKNKQMEKTAKKQENV